jgi:hypothetical protein
VVESSKSFLGAKFQDGVLNRVSAFPLWGLHGSNPQNFKRLFELRSQLSRQPCGRFHQSSQQPAPFVAMLVEQGSGFARQLHQIERLFNWRRGTRPSLFNLP